MRRRRKESVMVSFKCLYTATTYHDPINAILFQHYTKETT
jgi:hypothetical protein